MKTATSITLAACVCCTLLATPVVAALAIVCGSTLGAVLCAAGGILIADVLDTAGEMVWDMDPDNLASGASRRW